MYHTLALEVTYGNHFDAKVYSFSCILTLSAAHEPASAGASVSVHSGTANPKDLSTGAVYAFRASFYHVDTETLWLTI